jgi:hypothetical protein
MDMVSFGGGDCSSSSAAAAVAVAAASAADAEERQLLKGEMAVHPLCEQLVAAHVGCLRVATPIDHLPIIDAQLAQSSGLLHSYAPHHRPFLSPHDKQELDSFLVRSSSYHQSNPSRSSFLATSVDDGLCMCVSAGAVPDAAMLVQGAAAAARPRACRGGRHGVPGDRAVLAGPNWYTCLDLFYFNFHLLLL